MAQAQPAAGKPRPKFLDLSQIRLPLPAKVSILHRASGILLFLAMVWVLYLLDRSLSSAEGFAAIQAYFSWRIVKLAFIVLIWALCHHFCAGIRYLFLDLHKGLDLKTARATSVAVFVVSIALTIFFGVRIW